MDAIVREAREGDIPGILELYEGYFVTGAKIEDCIKSFEGMESLRGIHPLVAEAGGLVVGSCILYVLPSLARGRQTIAYVDHVIVDEKHRRKGIGKRLMDECVRIAKEASAYKLFLPSGFSRKEAHVFYEKAGFRGHGYVFQIDL